RGRRFGGLRPDADAGVREAPSIRVSAPSTEPLGAAATSIGVTRLTLTAFRSYSRLRVDLDRRPVVLTGANGAGKTNLLEALSFLAPGRGLRQARLAEVDRRQGALGSSLPRPWAVAARLGGPNGECDIGTGRDPAAEEGARDRRLLRIDATPYRGLNA